MNAPRRVADQAFERAVALHRQGQLVEAGDLYQSAVDADPGHVHALHLLGVIRQQQGRQDEGIALIREAIRRNPQYVEAYINLGVALGAMRRHEEAVASYRAALQINPGLPVAHNHLGLELSALERRQEAVDSYTRAIALDPGYVDAHYNLGTVLGELHRHDEASASYRSALAIDPGYARAHNGLGFSLGMLGRREEAIASYRTAIALDPDFAVAHYNLARALGRLGRHAESVEHYRKALAIEPGYAEAHFDLGVALNALDRHEEAIASYRKGLALKPGVAEAHNNLGASLSEMALYREAVASYREAVAINPGIREAHCNLGFGLLTLGDFAAGLPELEWRWGTEDVGPGQRYSQPQWSGTEDLAGKTILLHCEQGFGDTLNFARYAPLVAARGARVILAVQPQLKALMHGMSGADDVITRDDPLPAFDFHCPLMSLPLALGTTLQSIPAAVPYVSPAAERIGKWRALLGAPMAPRIGLIWLTRREHKNDRKRSIALQRLLPLLSVTGVQFVSLQKDLRDGAAETLNAHPEILHVGEMLDDFADTAAVVSLLDLVISVDTSALHLAGALGKPVWALLAFSADWRWLADRDDSPWYPTARLFRQPRNGDWDSVVRRVVEALAQRFAWGPVPDEESVRLHGLGVQHAQQGRFEEAIALFGEALEHAPNDADIHGNMGAALNDLKRYEEAAAHCRRALAINPNLVEVHNNLGNALNSLGRRDEAIASFRRALALDPEFADVHNNLGSALNDLARHEEAVASYGQAVALRPGFAEAHGNLGAALAAMHRCEDAVASYRRALALKPDYAGVYNNLGSALNDLRRHDEAIASYRQAIALRPGFAEAHSNLGTALASLHRNDEAIAYYRKALQLKPDYAGAYNNLGATLLSMNRTGEAFAAWRGALELKPDYHEAHTGLVAGLGYDAAVPLEAHLAERKRWEAQQVLARGIVPLAAHANHADPERRLRVGYVSADLRRHALASVVAPALIHYDRERFEVVCYYNHPIGDAVTGRFRQAVDGWREVWGVPDERVVDMIQADAIDILVDLSGHTVGNRLLAFARRPAPVQVTAWGHPTGTGLSAIDYLLSDPVMCPAEMQGHFAEQVVHLPCFINFTPPEPAPPVAALPARAAGYVTFGYFNNYNKLSDATLEVWGKLLAELPESRLLLKAREFAEVESRERVLGVLRNAGVEDVRIKFLGTTDWEQHMTALSEVDIALDPYPYAGGVSTMEALWMGVPVVTLKGEFALHRSGAAILTALGLTDWIAETPEQYLQIALRHARAVHTLEPLRQRLRGAVQASPLGNPTLYARAVDAAYRDMWRRWCESQPSAGGR